MKKTDIRNYGVLALVMFAAVNGCDRGPVSFVPVKGKITYADGTLIPGSSVVVRFIPIEPKALGKDVAGAATGYASARDGTFPGVTTWTPLDGVVPGWYKVVVIADASGSSSSRRVPAQYQRASTTPLKVEVTASNRFFPLQIEKPQ